MTSIRIVLPLAGVLGAIGLLALMTHPSTSAGGRDEPSLPATPAGQGGARPAPAASEPGEFEPTQLRRPVADAAPSGDELDASLESSVARDATEEAAQGPSAEELAEFREYVRSTLSEVRREKAAEMLSDIEYRSAGMDLRIAGYEDRLDLTPLQSARLRSALLAALEVEAEYVWQWELGADEQILAELKASDREAHLLELSSFLSAEQLEAYRRP